MPEFEQDAGVETFRDVSGVKVTYTYEHIEGRPEPDTDYFQITAVLDPVDRPLHKNVYFYPSDRLHEFFDGYAQTFEVVVDVRPVDSETVEDRIEEYSGGLD